MPRKFTCIRMSKSYTDAMWLRHFSAVTILLFAVSIQSAIASPGEYSLRAKIGPSFQIQDTNNGAKIGAEFDYELGFGFGFDLLAQIGIRDDPTLQLIPAIKYDVIYFIPGTLFVVAGAGWELFDFKNSALAVRTGTGMVLPLKAPWEFVTDINLIFTPNGAPGTPITFDWMIGIGARY